MCTRVVYSSYPETHSIHRAGWGKVEDSTDTAAVLLETHWWLCASSSSSQQWCQASPVLPSPQVSAPSRGDPKLSPCPWHRGANSSSALPIWPPPGPLSSFCVLENATQGGKFHQAAEHLAKLTKGLCTVCLIHGHFGIPHPKATYQTTQKPFSPGLGVVVPS